MDILVPYEMLELLDHPFISKEDTETKRKRKTTAPLFFVQLIIIKFLTLRNHFEFKLLYL